MKYLSILFIILGILGILHQRFFTSGGWFNWGHLFGIHHEPLIAACFVAGIVLWIVNLTKP